MISSIINKSEKLVKERFPMKWEEDVSDDADSPEIMTTEVDPAIMTEAVEREGNELPVDMSEWTTEELAAYNALRSKRKKCCVGGCTHRSIPIARSYHQLPVRNEEIWKKWVEIIRWSRNDVEWSPNGDAAPLVCSRHFPDSDFISYEASSRVRLSHTAIPVYFVDPPEGTVMNPRFSDPPPIPPISSINRQNGGSKIKKAKLENEYYNDEIDGRRSSTNSRNEFSSDAYYDPNDSPNYDHLGYDIEEVNEEGMDDFNNDDYSQRTPQPQSVLNFKRQNPPPGYSGVVKTSTSRNMPNIRLGSPPSLINFNKSPKQNSNISRTKLPALIKADNIMQANQLMIQRQSSSNSVPTQHLVVEGGLKSILNKSISSLNRSNGQKHKIGLQKCKLIIQTLDNQMKIAEVRLAEQLGIPVQVVRGVWNMRDSLREKL